MFYYQKTESQLKCCCWEEVNRPRTQEPTGWWCTPHRWPPPGVWWCHQSHCWWWSRRSSVRRSSAGCQTLSVAVAGTRPGGGGRSERGVQKVQNIKTYKTSHWYTHYMTEQVTFTAHLQWDTDSEERRLSSYLTDAWSDGRCSDEDDIWSKICCPEDLQCLEMGVRGQKKAFWTNALTSKCTYTPEVQHPVLL